MLFDCDTCDRLFHGDFQFFSFWDWQTGNMSDKEEEPKLKGGAKRVRKPKKEVKLGKAEQVKKPKKGKIVKVAKDVTTRKGQDKAYEPGFGPAERKKKSGEK